MTANSLLLCTDLDRTLLPNGKQPENPAAREKFHQLCADPDVTLVYVTGRYLKLVEQAIENYSLPHPDYIISDVGTRIYRQQTNQWQEVTAWQRQISGDWRGMTPGQLHQALKSHPELVLQEPEKQNDFKLSYYAPVETDSNLLLHRITTQLDRLGVVSNLVWSIDEPAQLGLIDVIPRSASKLHAIEFLQNFLQDPSLITLFAGDSGNDLQVLISAIDSVLVANADEDTKREAQRLAAENGHADSLYLAREDWSPLGGNYSAGILQGVAHFAPQFTDRFNGPGKPL